MSPSDPCGRTCAPGVGDGAWRCGPLWTPLGRRQPGRARSPRATRAQAVHFPVDRGSRPRSRPPWGSPRAHSRLRSASDHARRARGERGDAAAAEPDLTGDEQLPRPRAGGAPGLGRAGGTTRTRGDSPSERRASATQRSRASGEATAWPGSPCSARSRARCARSRSQACSGDSRSSRAVSSPRTGPTGSSAAGAAPTRVASCAGRQRCASRRRTTAATSGSSSARATEAGRAPKTARCRCGPRRASSGCGGVSAMDRADHRGPTVREQRAAPVDGPVGTPDGPAPRGDRAVGAAPAGRRRRTRTSRRRRPASRSPRPRGAPSR